MNAEEEPSDNPEYLRILASLPPDERLKLLGAGFDLQKQLNTKQEYRRAISELPPEARLALLDELRNRAELIEGRRRSPEPPQQCPSPGSNQVPQRFGGRATADGVGYETDIAAFLGVKMLVGEQSLVWEGVSGSMLSSIAMQTADPVDDIVIELNGDPESRVFISAKKRSQAISLTAKSPAFTETVDAFTRQFLALSTAARKKCRLVWCIPSTAGKAAKMDLREVLEVLRNTSSKSSVGQFEDSRNAKEKKVFGLLIGEARTAWQKHSGRPPTDHDLLGLAERVYVEIYDRKPQSLEAQKEIRNHVVQRPDEADRVWNKLQHFFLRADSCGISATPHSLRQLLLKEGIDLKAPPDYSDDIHYLKKRTSVNLEQLNDHTALRFGSKKEDEVHVSRVAELLALATATKSGHILLTGEPGCGKSGLLHSLVISLQKEGVPVVLLLAENIVLPEDKNPSYALGLSHSLDDVLRNWPSQGPGVLVTDALDAVRDPETQRRLRRLLVDIRGGSARWKVVASVRVFDLKFGRDLRASFPGTGASGYSKADLNGVAHFHLPPFSEGQLDELAATRPEIAPFIQAARANPKSEGIHRSPFHLRLAAELLSLGVPAPRLADWASPALLLRKFWYERLLSSSAGAAAQNCLRKLCARMVETRQMTVSVNKLSLDADEEESINLLRSLGVLHSPKLKFGSPVGVDAAVFTHHLLHDYAIARCLIPQPVNEFFEFTESQPLFPILYRQSFLFGLEELWDADDTRESFWETALRLENTVGLQSLSRILAPMLAARRVGALSDLDPLLRSIYTAADANSAAYKALHHLSCGLYESPEEAIQEGADGWGGFSNRLSGILPNKPFIEWPLVHILARLLSCPLPRESTRILMNSAAREILGWHARQGISRNRDYFGRTAIETVCRTFSSAPRDSTHALLLLMTPDRLSQFPSSDLDDLARNLRHLDKSGDEVVARLFEAAFLSEPKSGEYEDNGSRILGLRFQTKDQWGMVRYNLSEYYQARNGENAALMTKVACIAWNAVVRRKGRGSVIGNISFRGRTCELHEDYSHIWGRSFEHEEKDILSHFEDLLRDWAKKGDVSRLADALDALATCNRTSLIWNVFFEAGAEYPSLLGIPLGVVLQESLLLTHPDYAYGAAKLVGALHKSGGFPERGRLETLVVNLPNTARLHEGESRLPVPFWVQHAQDRLLGALERSNLVLDTARTLWDARRSLRPFPGLDKPAGPRAGFSELSSAEMLAQRGVDVESCENKEMSRLLEAIKPLCGSNTSITPDMVQARWGLIEECERYLDQYGEASATMAQELWGHLVGACENIANHMLFWSKEDERWGIVRRVLLKASEDPLPETAEDTEDEDVWPTWGWPAPRLDAARGLPMLAHRLAQVDQAIASALRRLCCDSSKALRFNLADRLPALAKPSPELMWELIDLIIEQESKFTVLDVLISSLDRLWEIDAEMVKIRRRLIAERARAATADNRIHKTIGLSYLWPYLQSGDDECKAYLWLIIEECHNERENHVIMQQLQQCRAGNWLVAGDGTAPGSSVRRRRAWDFFDSVLRSAKPKLAEFRKQYSLLSLGSPSDADAFKLLQAQIDRLAQLLDGIAMHLYFSSGAFAQKTNSAEGQLTEQQLRRFWQEARPFFVALASEPHPHTAHVLVQTLHHLLPCEPKGVFLLAAESILTSSQEAGFQYESLAVADVVRLIQRLLADHPEIFQREGGQESECLYSLLKVLELFVEAGWAEARQLTHRLEEMYR